MIGLISKFIPGASWINLAAGAVAGALLVSGPVYLNGRADGRELGRVAALEQAVKAYQQREDIDNATGNLSDTELCVILGGLPDECATVVRGLDETTGD